MSTSFRPPPHKGTGKPRAQAARVRPLNDREIRFVSEYVKDYNGTQAAIRAGYSEKGADVTAVRLLGRAGVVQAIQAQRQNALIRADVQAADVLRELARLALFDPRKLFDAEGNPKRPNELGPDEAAAIAGIDVLPDGRVRYKFADKGRPLELLGRHLGIYAEDNRQRAPGVTLDMGKFFADLFARPAPAADVVGQAPAADVVELAPVRALRAPDDVPGARQAPAADADLTDLLGDVPDAPGRPVMRPVPGDRE